MVKNPIKGPCSILDGGLSGKGWWLPVARCHNGIGLRCHPGLISFAVYSCLLKIVCVFNFWC